MGKNTDDVSEMVRIVVSEQFRHPELIGLDSIYDLTTDVELVSDLIPNQNSKRPYFDTNTNAIVYAKRWAYTCIIISPIIAF